MYKDMFILRKEALALPLSLKSVLQLAIREAYNIKNSLQRYFKLVF